MTEPKQVVKKWNVYTYTVLINFGIEIGASLGPPPVTSYNQCMHLVIINSLKFNVAINMSFHNFQVYEEEKTKKRRLLNSEAKVHVYKLSCTYHIATIIPQDVHSSCEYSSYEVN